MDRFMKAFDGITFETFVVAWLVGFGACVAPAATLFLTIGHVRHLDKVDAAVLFVLGLTIDLIRSIYGQQVFFKYFGRRSNAAESDEKTRAAKAAVEFEERKKKASEHKDSEAPGEVHAVAEPGE